MPLFNFNYNFNILYLIRKFRLKPYRLIHLYNRYVFPDITIIIFKSFFIYE